MRVVASTVICLQQYAFSVCKLLHNINKMKTQSKKSTQLISNAKLVLLIHRCHRHPHDHCCRHKHNLRVKGGRSRKSIGDIFHFSPPGSHQQPVACFSTSCSQGTKGHMAMATISRTSTVLHALPGCAVSVPPK